MSRPDGRYLPIESYGIVGDLQIPKRWADRGAPGVRVTTAFVRQGHYAHDPAILTANPPADLSVERIGDLVDYDLSALVSS